MMIASVLACLSCLLSTPADSIRFGGRFFPRIGSAADSGQAYSLLLPLDYSPARRHPLLIILDPRGRALVPLARFGPPAVGRGFVVMSSYNSASDGPVEPNVAAVNAMLGDAWRALRIDTTRVYLVGFSGTARFAWPAAMELRNVVRGIIQVGAGPNPPIEGWLAPFATDPSFAVFSAAGITDFNHDEVVDFDRRLNDTKIAHRTVVFSGAHEWVPPAVAAEAVEWLDLRDRVQRGLVADSVSERFRTERLVELDSIRAAGDTGEVVRRFTSLARDFQRDQVMMNYASQPAMVALLRRGPSFSAAERRRFEQERAWMIETSRTLGSLAKIRPESTADGLEVTLGVAGLKQRAKTDASGVDRAAAERRLAWLFANTMFYGPRTYRANQEWQPILTLLDVAHRIQTLPPDACETAAEALKQLRLGAAKDRYPECPGGG